MNQPLPVDDVLPSLLEMLLSARNVVLSAPPGAGKTTRVPLVLLGDERLAGRKMIMLQPRRLAAQRAATYMAAQIGERVGSTVGYRIRGESRISAATRLEVVTEGVLTRMLRHTPDLPGVGLLIFDEFHERSVHADLGLALALDAQTHLREDLRLLVMSATLDGVAVAQLLGNAPVVESIGRSHPVATRYLPSPQDEPLAPLVLRAIRTALRNDTGDILVFLPGQREIRRVESLLQDAALPQNVTIHTLFGEATASAQDAALAPAPPGVTKVILATSIAETSLTIDGVRVVIDSGLARSARFDPRRGMSGLVTGPVSRAAADQRRGRAGRQSPGVCYRLWTEEQHRQLQDYPSPEILVTDLAPLALDLSVWGTPDGAGLRFLDPPPATSLAQARELLRKLAALDERGLLTHHGRAMAELPVHPRLSHMILRGKDLGFGAPACELAALLEERDPLRGEQGTDLDIASRWQAVYAGGTPRRSLHGRIVREAHRLKELAGVSERRSVTTPLGLLTAFAYPERIARRRGTEIGRYLTANGTGAVVPEWSMLSREEFLAIAEVDGVGTNVKVFLAAPLLQDDLLDYFAELMVDREEVFWSDQDESVIARSLRTLGSLVLAERPTVPEGALVLETLLTGIRRMGLACLPWNRETESLRSRSEWLRRVSPPDNDWPDLSDSSLVETLNVWLGPFLAGITRRTQLQAIPLGSAIRSMFTHRQLAELDRQAPAVWITPAGSRTLLKYVPGETPVAAVKLQEMFGQRDTPVIAGGRVKLLIHLLSPAGRPLAVTQDLGNFWKNVYPEVRKEMRGRYPKHIWPDDPLSSKPTRRTVKRTARR